MCTHYKHVQLQVITHGAQIRYSPLSVIICPAVLEHLGLLDPDAEGTTLPRNTEYLPQGCTNPERQTYVPWRLVVVGLHCGT